MAQYYRIKIDVTYTTAANATTAGNSLNSILSTQGRAERATTNVAQVYLMIPGIASQSAAEALMSALNPGWQAAARSYGKVSIVRTDAMT